MSGAFLDTNILIYAFSSDAKARRAQALLQDPFTVGVQGLNEFGSVARRKLQLDWPAVATAVNQIAVLSSNIVETTFSDIQRSISLAERYRLQLFDALMLAVALRAGCTTFLSEDMHDGLVIDDRLTISDPFADKSAFHGRQ